MYFAILRAISCPDNTNSCSIGLSHTTSIHPVCSSSSLNAIIYHTLSQYTGRGLVQYQTDVTMPRGMWLEIRVHNNISTLVQYSVSCMDSRFVKWLSLDHHRHSPVSRNAGI